jgi:hypothetical protein
MRWLFIPAIHGVALVPAWFSDTGCDHRDGAWGLGTALFLRANTLTNGRWQGLLQEFGERSPHSSRSSKAYFLELAQFLLTRCGLAA